MSADANTTNLAYCLEDSFGVLPADPEFTTLRLTGETLAHAKTTVVSEEIRSDRQVPDMVKVGADASGAFNLEFSRDEYIPFLEAVLCGTFTTFTSGAVSATTATSGQTLTGAAGDFDDIPVGGWVKVTGGATTANNGLKRVVGKNNDGSVLTFAAGSFTANETANFTVATSDLRNGTTRRSYTFERDIVNAAGAHAFQRYRGCVIGKATLSVESKKIVTGSFEVMGKYGETASLSLNTRELVAATGTLTAAGNPSADDTVTVAGRTYTFKASLSGADQVLIGADASATLDNLIAAINGAAGAGTTYGNGTTAHATVTAAAGSGDTMVVTAVTGGTAGNALATTEASSVLSWGAATLTGGVAHEYAPATDNPVINGTSHVLGLHYGDAAMSDKAKMISFALDNGLRGKDALGEEGNFEIGLGTFNVTGRLQIYFNDNTVYQALIAHDDVSLSFLLTDDDGDSIAFTFPRIKFGNGNPNAGAINTDVMLDIDFQAIRDPESGKTMIVNKFDA